MVVEITLGTLLLLSVGLFLGGMITTVVLITSLVGH